MKKTHIRASVKTPWGVMMVACCGIPSRATIWMLTILVHCRCKRGPTLSPAKCHLGVRPRPSTGHHSVPQEAQPSHHKIKASPQCNASTIQLVVPSYLQSSSSLVVSILLSILPDPYLVVTIASCLCAPFASMYMLCIFLHMMIHTCSIIESPYGLSKGRV